MSCYSCLSTDAPRVHGRKSKPTARKCICIFVCVFFPSGTSLRVRTFVPNVGWGGHNSTVGLTLLEVWARSVQCVARGKPFKTFLALGTLKAYPRVSATSPGIEFLHPLSPRTHVKLGCKPGFSALVEGTRFFPYFCTEPRLTILPPSSSSAP